MRIAALLCGLIAGLFALVAPFALGVDLLTPSLRLWGTSTGQQLLGTLAWYALPAAAMLGGLLALVTPGLGALMMLGAALGWAGFGIGDQSLLRYEILVPAGSGLVGAALAFVGGELELRRRRAARRNRRTLVQESAERAEKDRRAREAAFNVDPRTVPREEAPPRPSRQIPLTLEDVTPAAKISETPPRRSETIWPDPPSRKPIFERPDPGPEFPRPIPVSRRPAAATQREYREVEHPKRDRYRDRHDDEPRTAGPNRVLVWLAAVNGIVVIGLGTAVGYMIVEGRRPTPQAVATAVTEAAPVAKTTPASAESVAPVKIEEAPVAVAPLPVVSPPRLVAEAADAGPALPMAADATVPAVAEAEAADTAVAETDVASASYADPYAYCAAVKTIDFVDNRYAGPRFTQDIANALRVPLTSSPDRVSWRCVDGTVYACASFDWPACAMTPTADEMRDYCQRNPGVRRLLAPNGTWSCEGNRPTIPEGERWPVDARGFLPNAWIPVLPTEAQPTG